MSGAEIHFDTAVVCDDIRQENNGKVILIGVYVNDIVVPRFPAPMVLFLHTGGAVIVPGNLELTLSVEGDDGSILFRSEDHLPPAAVDFRPGRFMFNFNALCTLTKPLELRFVVHVSGESHQVAARRVITPDMAEAEAAT